MFPMQEQNNNKDRLNKDALIKEIEKCKALQEQIVNKVNDTKKLLHKNEQVVNKQAKNLQEIESSSVTSSGKLELEEYNRWTVSKSLKSLRSASEVIYEFAINSEHILNQCQNDNNIFKAKLMKQQTLCDNYKQKWDDQLKTQINTIKQLSENIQTDSELHDKDISAMIDNINTSEQERQSEQGELQDLINKYNDFVKEDAACEAECNLVLQEIDVLDNELLQKEKDEESLLREVEENKHQYNDDIAKMNTLIEGITNELKHTTENNSTIESLLLDQNKQNEDILSASTEFEKQLADYKQKCLDIDSKENQQDIIHKGELEKVNNDLHHLSETAALSEKRYFHELQLRDQMNKDLDTLNKDLQCEEIADIDLAAKVEELEAINYHQLAEITEEKKIIETVTDRVLFFNGEVLEMQKKISNNEIELYQRTLEYNEEIRKLTKDVQITEENENLKYNTLVTEIEVYEQQARDNIASLESQTKEKLAQFDNEMAEIKKNIDVVVSRTKQHENDLQNVTLDYDILNKRIQDTENQKRKLISEREHIKLPQPRLFKQRNMEEMSESSVEGALTVQEYIEAQRAKVLKKKKTDNSRGLVTKK